METTPTHLNYNPTESRLAAQLRPPICEAALIRSLHHGGVRSGEWNAWRLATAPDERDPFLDRFRTGFQQRRKGPPGSPYPAKVARGTGAAQGGPTFKSIDLASSMASPTNPGWGSMYF